MVKLELINIIALAKGADFIFSPNYAKDNERLIWSKYNIEMENPQFSTFAYEMNFTPFVQ